MSGDNDVLRPGGLCLELRVCTRQAPRRTPEQSHSALSSEPRGTAYGPLDPNSDPIGADQGGSGDTLRTTERQHFLSKSKGRHPADSALSLS
jgi:hypothetical protein